MSVRHELRIRNANGVLKNRIGMGSPDPDGHYVAPLSYLKVLNKGGVLTFSANGDHPALDNLERNGQVEVWRKVDDNDWYLDFIGVWLEDYDYQYEEKLIFTGYVPHILTVLKWGIIAWKASTNNRSEFSSDPAETIMKTLVQYNVTDDATEVNSRELDWQSPFTITIEADGAGGNTKNWNCAWKNLLDTLSDLALIAGGDFDLIRDPDNDGSYTKLEFRFYSGQRGRDLTSNVIIAVSRGNMANVLYQHRGSQTKTAGIVGGQGQEDDRDIEVVTSADDGANFHREIFINATEYSGGNTSGLQAKGNTKLEELSDSDKLSFDILQTENAKYGVHYGINLAGDYGVLGDLITVIRPHDQVSQTHKIIEVGISIDEISKEKVRVETIEQ